MKILQTPLAGMFEIQHTPSSDARGSFTRLFCEDELAAIRPGLHFRQINLSRNVGRGTLRGLHYQMPPHAEAKLIRCLLGQVFDVAVDLRPGSPTFLHWHAVELAESNDRAVFLPEGFAHGFQTLSDEAHLLYMHTASWVPNCDSGLRHDDPRLAIDWPLPVAAISERDMHHPLIDAMFAGVTS